MDINYSIEIARQAGKILKNNFGKSLTVSSKDKKGLLTEADLKSEKFIISKILEKFPNHSILSEEKGLVNGSNDFKWIIDPLDGTTNFAFNLPYFSVSMALVHKKQTILGITYNPITDELFFAEKNKGAYLNSRRMSVSKRRELINSVIILNKSYESFSDLFKKTSRLSDNVLTIRIFGATSLDLCQVALGKADGLINLEAESWDHAAGALIAGEAGALMLDLMGRKIVADKKQSLVVSNPSIFSQIWSNL